MSQDTRTNRQVFHVGDIFSGVIKGLNFHMLQGTYPAYGRVIDEVEKVSEHKLIVELGEVERFDSCDERSAAPSSFATIGVYGEIDDRVKLKEN